MGYRKHQLHIEVFDHHTAVIARELYVCRACGAEVWVEAPARDRPTTFAWLQAEHDAKVARPRWSVTLRSSSVTWSTVPLPSFRPRATTPSPVDADQRSA